MYTGCGLGALPADQTIAWGGVAHYADPWDWLAKLRAGDLGGLTPEQQWDLFTSVRVTLASIPEYAEVLEQIMYAIQALRAAAQGTTLPDRHAAADALLTNLTFNGFWLQYADTTATWTSPHDWRVMVGGGNNYVVTWDSIYRAFMQAGYGDLATEYADRAGEMVAAFLHQTPAAPPAPAPAAPPPSPGPAATVAEWLAYLAEYGTIGGRYAVAGVIIEVRARGDAWVVGETPHGEGGEPPSPPAPPSDGGAPAPDDGGLPTHDEQGAPVPQQAGISSGVLLVGGLVGALVLLFGKKGKRSARRVRRMKGYRRF